jgi:hypothetical protein
MAAAAISKSVAALLCLSRRYTHQLVTVMSHPTPRLCSGERTVATVLGVKCRILRYSRNYGFAGILLARY